MADVFDIKSSGKWTFKAVASRLLEPVLTTPTENGGLGFDPKQVQFAAGGNLKPTHDAQYWEAKTHTFDFSGEDRVPTELYNKILWEGLKGTPAPAATKHASKVAAEKETDDD
jgi:hypothetical protein